MGGTVGATQNASTVAGRSEARTDTSMAANAKEYPLRIIGLLYAMAAAELNDDHEATALLRGELEERESEHFPEAAVAIAAAALHRSGYWSSDAPELQAVPRTMMDVIEKLLDGERPGEVRLEAEEDPVVAAVRTVAVCWSWYVGGDLNAARELARQHCMRMSMFKLENGITD